MIRLLHLADLHLGTEPSYLGDVAKQRGNDFINAFERAVDFALAPENDIHGVLIAGDLFDRHNPPKTTLRFTIKQLKRLQQAKVPVILTPGNHDSIDYPDSVYQDNSTEIRKLVTIIDCPIVERGATLEINGEIVHFYGMAWYVNRSIPPFDEFQAHQEEGIHIAVIHGTLDSAHYIEAHSRDVPLKLLKLAKTKMNYIALGHIHSPQTHMAGSTPVVYPGTLEGKRFVSGEEGERKLVVVELEKGHPVKLEFIPWNQRVLQRARLDLDKEVIETEDELVDLIINRYGDPNKLLRLEIAGTAPFVIDAESLGNRLVGEFFWCEIRDHTNIFRSGLIDEWSYEETIRGLYIQKLSNLIEEEEDPQEQERIALALKIAIQSFNKTLRRG